MFVEVRYQPARGHAVTLAAGTMVPVTFPLIDPIGPYDTALPPADVRFIADHVAAHAAAFEAEGVPRSLLTDLGARGLFGAPHVQQRELAELLAGSSADAWFCWAQHATPLRTVQSAQGIAAHALRDAWLADLVSGQAIAAVAFAHLRRPGKPNPGARKVSGGWRVSGTLDWITSWDIADVLLLMVRRDEHVVQFLIPLGDGAPQGMDVGPVLDLVAMRGTHTRAAVLTDVFLPDDWVLDQVPLNVWAQADAVKTAEANPAVFGIIRSAVAEIADIAQQKDDALLYELIDALAARCRALRTLAYGDQAGVERRAQAVQLAMTSATSAISVRAGSAMHTGSPAERRARAALFMHVQAQTVTSRDAAVHLTISGL